MGSKGDCFDNAVAESFFATLEKDLLRRKSLRPDRTHGRRSSTTSRPFTTRSDCTQRSTTSRPSNTKRSTERKRKRLIRPCPQTGGGPGRHLRALERASGV